MTALSKSQSLIIQKNTPLVDEIIKYLRVYFKNKLLLEPLKLYNNKKIKKKRIRSKMEI